MTDMVGVCGGEVVGGLKSVFGCCSYVITSAVSTLVTSRDGRRRIYQAQEGFLLDGLEFHVLFLLITVSGDACEEGIRHSR